MERRRFQAGLSAGVIAGTAGCAEIQGAVLGTTPEQFEIENEMDARKTVDVRIEADDELVLDERWKIEASIAVTKPWPDAKATTYRLWATVGDEYTGMAFDPADWKKRQTPLVSIANGGVGVSVTD